MSAILFYPELHEAWFSPEFFLTRYPVPMVARIVIEVATGAVVAPGDSIGTIDWDDGTTEQILAPGNMGGIVDLPNRQVPALRVYRHPALFAVVIKR